MCVCVLGFCVSDGLLCGPRASAPAAGVNESLQASVSVESGGHVTAVFGSLCDPQGGPEWGRVFHSGTPRALLTLRFDSCGLFDAFPNTAVQGRCAPLCPALLLVEHQREEGVGSERGQSHTHVLFLDLSCFLALPLSLSLPLVFSLQGRSAQETKCNNGNHVNELLLLRQTD